MFLVYKVLRPVDVHEYALTYLILLHVQHVKERKRHHLLGCLAQGRMFVLDTLVAPVKGMSSTGALILVEYSLHKLAFVKGE